MDESELKKKSIEGDNEAFERLTKPYTQGIVNHAYVMLRNREDALVMAQEALVKAFVSIAGFNGQSSFKTWLYRITTNVCLDFLRKKKREANIVSLTTGDDEQQIAQLDVADASTDPQRKAEQKELREAIIKAIGELDDEYRAAIALRELEGMDYKQIATTLRVSLGTVKSRINRARMQLREKLSNYRELL